MKFYININDKHQLILNYHISKKSQFLEAGSVKLNTNNLQSLIKKYDVKITKRIKDPLGKVNKSEND